MVLVRVLVTGLVLEPALRVLELPVLVLVWVRVLV